MNLRKSYRRLFAPELKLGIPEMDQCLPRGLRKGEVLNVVISTPLHHEWTDIIKQHNVHLWAINSLGPHYWFEKKGIWLERELKTLPDKPNVIFNHRSHKVKHEDFRIVVYGSIGQCKCKLIQLQFYN